MTHDMASLYAIKKMHIYDPPDVMTRKDLEDLNLSIFSGNPLGRGFTPLNSRSVLDNSLRFTYTRCSSFEKVLDPEVRVITGRRGSGKSALISVLKSQQHYDYCIECDPNELRKWVLSSTEMAYSQTANLTADDYIKECIHFFWLLVFRRLHKESEGRADDIRALLEHLKLLERSSIHDAVVEWASRGKDSDSAAVSVTSGLLTWFVNRNRAEFKRAIAEAGNLLNNKKVVILIDNPEDYAIYQPEGLSGQDQSNQVYRNPRAIHLFQALTFAAATFQPNEARIFVKYFIPTEIYRFLSRDAINWGKTRGSIHALRWKPNELLCMVAKRLRFYRFRCGQITNDEINLTELDHPATAYQEWKAAFEEKVENLYINISEHSWHYVLRHTQLMPRQVIAYGNRILDKASENSGVSFRASAKDIRDGVDSAETDNAKDSLGIFSQIHGPILKFCEDMLVDLSPQINLETLEEKVYQPIKDGLKSELGVKSFPEFKRLMAEIGVLGIGITSKDVDCYHCAKFEDEVDDILRMEAGDTLYVHPMFLRHLSTNRRKTTLCKAVSPYSTIDCMRFLSA